MIMHLPKRTKKEDLSFLCLGIDFETEREREQCVLKSMVVRLESRTKSWTKRSLSFLSFFPLPKATPPLLVLKRIYIHLICIALFYSLSWHAFNLFFSCLRNVMPSSFFICVSQMNEEGKPKLQGEKKMRDCSKIVKRLQH